MRKCTFHFALPAYFCHIPYITFSIKNIPNCRKNICGFYTLYLGFTYPISFKHHNDPREYFYFYFTGEETKIHHTSYAINRTKSLTYTTYVISNVLHLSCLMSDISIETQDHSILLHPCEFPESALHINF